MAAKINRAVATALAGLCLLLLLNYTSVAPNSISTYVSNFVPHESPTALDEDITRPQEDSKVLDSKQKQDDSQVAKPKGKDLALAFLDEPIPRRNFSLYAERPPYKPVGKGNYAYATMLCTRKPDMRDPFFAATQSLVWRLLWSEWHGSYPVIVYVCPFTPEEQRVVLRGQGAIVKEIGLLDNIVPANRVPLARWLDQFSKLNMWKQTDYDLIAYLDVDALPVSNIDDVFDILPKQTCEKSLLNREDRAMMAKDKKAGDEFCKYTFAGVDPYGEGEINGGFLVFKPNMLMYEKLIRSAQKIEEYDLTKMEQGLLHSKLAFGQDGPFKAHNLPQVYNAVPDYYLSHRDNDGESTDGPIRVIHDKLWSVFGTLDRPELTMRWDLDWMSMCRFYDGKQFADARENGRLKDGLEYFLEGATEGVEE